MLAASVAAIRSAVRDALAGLPPREQPLALVACSGGADSLALAAATGFVAPRAGWRAGLLTVDHRLQAGSGERAEAVAGWAREQGFDPVRVLPVTVAGRSGSPGPTPGPAPPLPPRGFATAPDKAPTAPFHGPEAAARSARYQALEGAATELGAAAVLLGHTRDDQAETVLLALARGAGPRGLAGMPACREDAGVRWLRPLLSVGRAQTRDACAALELAPWEDPHNTDPAYARARVRGSALPALVAALGERVVDNLARTAAQVASDNAALDGLAAAALASARTAGCGLAVGDGLAIGGLREQPDAIRTRVLHAWARELGAPGGALSHRHVAALDALLTDWHGQGPVYLPGGIKVTRHGTILSARS